MTYEICKGCGAAKNPRAKLSFHETDEWGTLCGNCFGKKLRQGPPAGPPQDEFVVVPCPACEGRGKAGAPKHQRCSTCVGFGSVRVASNALPIFTPKMKEEPAEPQLLTEVEVEPAESQLLTEG